MLRPAYAFLNLRQSALLTFGFFVWRANLYRQLSKPLNAGGLRGVDGGDNQGSFCAQLIAVCFWHLADHSMSAQKAQLATDFRGLAPLLVGREIGLWKQERKTVNGKAPLWLRLCRAMKSADPPPSFS